MTRDFLVYIEDILDAMEKAQLIVIVWDVVSQDIPRVKPALQQILQDHGGGSSNA